jgi:hypothetical protein
MSPRTLLRPAAWLLPLVASLLAVLVSCGGDGAVGSGGTGAPIGLAVGTVNGFGSVIVDGVSYDDTQAPVVTQVAPGLDAPAGVRLGDRTDVTFGQAGVATQIRVDSALLGSVSSVNAAGLVALGQTVSVNTDPANGPITQMGGGFNSLADVQVGDWVDVRGFLVTQGNSTVLQATRLDLASAPTWLRVTGVVTQAGGSSTFAIGSLAVDAHQATVLPAGASIAVGRSVVVLAAPASLSLDAMGNPSITAAEVRVLDDNAAQSDIWLSGRASSVDAGHATLLLGTQLVRWANAAVSPSAGALVEGAYVQVHGTVAADGAIDATSIMVRGPALSDDSALTGNITAFDPATQTFMVRDTHVDASTATLQGCPAGGLANGLFVQVQGQINATGVVASSVQCQSEPAGATVERDGTASAVDTTALTFMLVSSHGTTIAVQWSATTFFSGVSPQTLSGKSLEVQGTFSGTVLVARKIELDN